MSEGSSTRDDSASGFDGEVNDEATWDEDCAALDIGEPEPLMFAGYANWVQTGSVRAVHDAAMEAACTAFDSDSRPATMWELVYGDYIGRPATNTSGQYLEGLCPYCEGADAGARNCVGRTHAWPTSISPWPSERHCRATATRSTLCVKSRDDGESCEDHGALTTFCDLDPEEATHETALGCGTVPHDLRIEGASPEELCGLMGIQSVGDLQIHNNPAITNLSGLYHLEYVGNNITINNNASLTSLMALTALGHLGGSLYITNNTSLCQTDVENFRDWLSSVLARSVTLVSSGNADC